MAAPSRLISTAATVACQVRTSSWASPGSSILVRANARHDSSDVFAAALTASGVLNRVAWRLSAGANSCSGIVVQNVRDAPGASSNFMLATAEARPRSSRTESPTPGPRAKGAAGPATKVRRSMRSGRSWNVIRCEPSTTTLVASRSIERIRPAPPVMFSSCHGGSTCSGLTARSSRPVTFVSPVLAIS
jgi:hypothetical protein